MGKQTPLPDHLANFNMSKTSSFVSAGHHYCLEVRSTELLLLLLFTVLDHRLLASTMYLYVAMLDKKYFYVDAFLEKFGKGSFQVVFVDT